MCYFSVVKMIDVDVERLLSGLGLNYHVQFTV